MSEVESLINIPVEHCSNIFGQFDEYAKVIEKTLKSYDYCKRQLCEGYRCRGSSAESIRST